MVTIQRNKIINRIDAYINRSLPYSSWYIGIAKNPEKRLFVEHNVSRANPYWIYNECPDDTTSRDIELYFLRLGCKGGDGGGNQESRFVYAYKITSTTIE